MIGPHHEVAVGDAYNDLLMLVARRPREVWASCFRERWSPRLRGGGNLVRVLGELT
ncbi:hypothetical protein AB0K48_09495 [Nonomuraea sp. NPDC055795]